MTPLDAVLLVIRAVLGATFLIHGGQKLMGWYGGRGVTGTEEMMGMLGMAHPKLMGTMAAVSEFGGGLLVLFGLLTQFAAAAIIGTMFVAISTVHLAKGFLSTEGGYEFNLSLITLALVLMFLGAGSMSIDRYLGIARPVNEMPALANLLLLLIMFGGWVMTQVSRRINMRRAEPAPWPTE